MNSKQVSFVDVLFEGRNKAYGAYDLRVHYTERLQKAVLLAVAMAGTVIWLSWWVSLRGDDALTFSHPSGGHFPPSTVTRLTDLRELSSGGISNAGEQFVIVRDHEVVEKPDKPEPVKPTDHSASSGNGGGNNTGGGDLTGGGPAGPGPSEVVEPVKPEPPAAAVDFAEAMPEFPGGEDAMMAFLGKHMRYPALAKDAGIEGRVVIAFIVNEAGAITDLHVIRGIGGGCDEEAVRVVKMMPSWKAGEQNGRKVRVNYVLPVTFKLQ